MKYIDEVKRRSDKQNGKKETVRAGRGTDRQADTKRGETNRWKRRTDSSERGRVENEMCISLN